MMPCLPLAEFAMTLPRTVVFDLDGTLVDTAPDLIAALNFVLDREGLPPVPLKSARNMIGAGARKLLERGLEVDGRATSVEDLNRSTKDFIDYYADHIADASRPFEDWKPRSTSLRLRAAASRCAPTSWNGCRNGCSTNWA